MFDRVFRLLDHLLLSTKRGLLVGCLIHQCVEFQVGPHRFKLSLDGEGFSQRLACHRIECGAGHEKRIVRPCQILLGFLEFDGRLDQFEFRRLLRADTRAHQFHKVFDRLQIPSRQLCIVLRKEQLEERLFDAGQDHHFCLFQAGKGAADGPIHQAR